MREKGFLNIKNVTPTPLRCVVGACPAIYEVQRLTPEAMRCVIGACSEIYSEPDGTYLIIGKVVSSETARQISLEVGKTLAEKIGPEALIRVSKRLIDERLLSK